MLFFKSRFLIFLFFLSCSTNSDWEISAIYSQDKNHLSQRILHKSKDPFSGLDVECIFIGEETSAYLILPHPINEKNFSSVISISSDNQTIEESAQILDGGYKVKLPEKLHHFFLQQLQKGSSVEFTFNQYNELIETNFKK